MKEKIITPMGILVKNALKEKKMTQVELAKEIGTSKQYLYLILNGDRSGDKYLQSIAKICDLDLQDMTKKKRNAS